MAKSEIEKFMETPFAKGVLEALRWAVLGAVSLFVEKLIELIPGMNLDANFVVILTAVLRLIDSLLHKSGVAEKGIVRF